MALLAGVVLFAASLVATAFAYRVFRLPHPPAWLMREFWSTMVAVGLTCLWALSGALFVSALLALPYPAWLELAGGLLVACVIVLALRAALPPVAGARPG